MRASPILAFTFLSRWAADLMVCLRFYTRLPLPVLWFEPVTWDGAGFGRALRLAPLAGLVIGALGALVLLVAIRSLGLPPAMAATLALTAQIAVSGALHEDGLADVADGFGGGRTLEGKLDIMRDSRIGTFGTLALILSAALRIIAVTSLLQRYGVVAAAAALPAAAAASRGLGLLPLAMLRPARGDGLAHAAGPIGAATLGLAVGGAVFLGMTVPFIGGFAQGRALAACIAGLIASIAVTRLAYRQIGGQTGDVAGVAQQACEIAYLLALLIAPWRA